MRCCRSSEPLSSSMFAQLRTCRGQSFSRLPPFAMLSSILSSVDGKRWLKMSQRFDFYQHHFESISRYWSQGHASGQEYPSGRSWSPRKKSFYEARLQMCCGLSRFRGLLIVLWLRLAVQEHHYREMTFVQSIANLSLHREENHSQNSY